MLTLTISIPDDHAPLAQATACEGNGHPVPCPAPEACIGDYITRRTAQEIRATIQRQAERAAAEAAQPIDTTDWEVTIGGTEP